MHRIRLHLGSTHQYYSWLFCSCQGWRWLKISMKATHMCLLSFSFPELHGECVLIHGHVESDTCLDPHLCVTASTAEGKHLLCIWNCRYWTLTYHLGLEIMEWQTVSPFGLHNSLPALIYKQLLSKPQHTHARTIVLHLLFGRITNRDLCGAKSIAYV
jgi:hypothetical protein